MFFSLLGVSSSLVQAPNPTLPLYARLCQSIHSDSFDLLYLAKQKNPAECLVQHDIRVTPNKSTLGKSAKCTTKQIINSCSASHNN